MVGTPLARGRCEMWCEIRRHSSRHPYKDYWSAPKDFSHLDLNGRNFIQAKMFGAVLTGANLGTANLMNAHLSGLELSEAIWVDVKLPKGWKIGA